MKETIMIDNKRIADYLHELVRKRNNELIQNQELNNWSEAEECYYQDRTDEICKIANELEKDADECEILTLDEAIRHANEIAQNDESLCANNHKQLANWLTELQDVKNKYAYLAADFDNYKKRVAKNDECFRDKAFQDVIMQFLRTYDDMERLHEMIDLSSDEPNTEENKKDVGFEIIFENFEKTLINLGCKKIICEVGDKFDVDYMEAISTREVGENDSIRVGDVAEIFQSGWKYKDKVIRPVKVIVGK